LAYFMVIWYSFPVLVCSTDKNLATLLKTLWMKYHGMQRKVKQQPKRKVCVRNHAKQSSMRFCVSATPLPRVFCVSQGIEWAERWQAT
jgi:hypothetical protein